MFEACVLGCTDRRAGLGIHRTQAGRSGSSPGVYYVPHVVAILGRHSGLRWGRIAGLLGHPMGRTPSARLPRGGGRSGPVAPRRDRRGRRTLCGPADPPGPDMRAAARTAARVKFADWAAGRESWAGRRTGPAQVSRVSAHPLARAANRVSQAAGGALTGPWPAPATGVGRAGRARVTRTSLPPEGAEDGRGRTASGPARCKGPTLT